MYIKIISIPPIITKNKIYEIQNDWDKIPIIIEINKVWTTKINPKVKGCFILKKIKDEKVIK